MRRSKLAVGERITLIDHLDELRRRMLFCLGFVGVAFVAAYALHGRIIDALIRPLPAGHRELVTFGVAEPFMMSMRVSAYAAVAVCVPVLLWQLWRYVAPAFGEAPQRLVVGFSITGALLLAVGVAFGYEIALPKSLAFLVGFDDGIYEQQLRAPDYLNFACMVIVACGVVFELPLVVLGLVRFGVLDAERLRGSRRMGYAAVCVLAVLLPGVDPVTTAIEAVPLFALYEATMLIAVIWQRRRRRAEDAAFHQLLEPPAASDRLAA